MWSGGVVGLKSILGVKKRERALEILEQLSSHGYLSYELNSETKQLTYRITDWEMDHCGSECESGNVYTTPGYGFLCVPRRITERLLSIQYYKYEESDAFLDLWCHTVYIASAPESVVYPVSETTLPQDAEPEAGYSDEAAYDDDFYYEEPYDEEYYEYEDILISGIPLKHALFFIIGLFTCISILVALQIASVRISEDDDFDDNDE
jgi:hypothetical protein